MPIIKMRIQRKVRQTESIDICLHATVPAWMFHLEKCVLCHGSINEDRDGKPCMVGIDKYGQRYIFHPECYDKAPKERGFADKEDDDAE